ncbi:MAG: hypothetical protein JXK16_03725 [Thiotrichales bacterium]|nr:hypothetical protein [Thiotrichales bacterium]
MNIKFIQEIKTRTIRERLNSFNKNEQELIFNSDECGSPESSFVMQSYYQYLAEHTIDAQLVIRTKQKFYLALQAKKVDPQIISDCLDILHREQEKLIAIGYYSASLLKMLSLFHHIDIEQITYEEIIDIKKLN